mmetsp:Transcript_24759/g.71549  ORF Transcript_24759/g.71549 Transcript_24759/m.71549 type:complete len:222 (-) Transcript_24759:746-1411(-)
MKAMRPNTSNTVVSSSSSTSVCHLSSAAHNLRTSALKSGSRPNSARCLQMLFRCDGKVSPMSSTSPAASFRLAKAFKLLVFSFTVRSSSRMSSRSSGSLDLIMSTTISLTISKRPTWVRTRPRPSDSSTWTLLTTPQASCSLKLRTLSSAALRTETSVIQASKLLVRSPSLAAPPRRASCLVTQRHSSPKRTATPQLTDDCAYSFCIRSAASRPFTSNTAA